MEDTKTWRECVDQVYNETYTWPTKTYATGMSWSTNRPSNYGSCYAHYGQYMIYDSGREGPDVGYKSCLFSGKIRISFDKIIIQKYTFNFFDNKYTF